MITTYPSNTVNVKGEGEQFTFSDCSFVKSVVGKFDSGSTVTVGSLTVKNKSIKIIWKFLEKKLPYKTMYLNLIAKSNI